MVEWNPYLFSIPPAALSRSHCPLCGLSQVLLSKYFSLKTTRVSQTCCFLSHWVFLSL